jgi:hypothetical protein
MRRSYQQSRDVENLAISLVCVQELSRGVDKKFLRGSALSNGRKNGIEVANGSYLNHARTLQLLVFEMAIQLLIVSSSV